MTHPEAIASFKRNHFIPTILAVFMLFFFSAYSYANDEKERGYKGTISKEALLAELQEIQEKKNTYAEGYIIQGDDIISIIEQTDVAIKISNSIIEGGLDFTQLPGVSLDKDNLLASWSEEAKKEWLEKQTKWNRKLSYLYYKVTNRIVIIDSEIQSGKSFFSVNSARAIFSEKVIFNQSTFSRKADFSGATFSRYASFYYSTFSGYAYFFYATFRTEVYFHNTTFSKFGNFHHSTFSSSPSFSGAIFSSDAAFHSATFKGGTSFQHATFSGNADFNRVIFGAYGIRFTVFSGATFSRYASFSGSSFGRASFSDTIFSGNASFSDTTFSGNADFYQAHFNGDADFFQARFKKLAYFNEAQFFSVLKIKQVIFKEYVDLRNTKIRKLDFDSRESPTIFKVHFDLRGAIISEAHFQDIIFEKDIYFSDARFGVPVGEKKEADGAGEESSSLSTVFRFVTFESQADFKRTAFLGNTGFENVTFMNDADFTDADFKVTKKRARPKFSLSYLHFNNLRIKWDQLPDIEFWVSGSQERIENFSDREMQEEKKKDKSIEKEQEASEIKKLEPLSSVLKNLEASFRNNKQLYDANQAYFHKKRAELKEAKEGDDDWLTKQREAEWLVWGIPCGYGTKIWWILGWTFLTTVLFAVVYSFKGELNRQPHPATTSEFNFRQRLLDFPKNYYSQKSRLDMKKSTRNFINALRFSSVILLKFGYRDTTISGKILGINYKFIVWIEWLLGYYILAALAVTISNTLPVVNRLISGVF